MTRKQFKEKLTARFNTFNLTRKTLRDFKRFKHKDKNSYRKKLLANPELGEQYYVWHLLQELNGWFNLIRLEKVVTEYYKNSKIINEIWREG